MTAVSPVAVGFGGQTADGCFGGWPESPHLPEQAKPDALPVASLPSVLQSQVRSVADAMQVSADLPCLLSLACISTALAGRVEVEVRPGWREPLGIYVACVLPPATRKSPCYASMTAPVRSWEADCIAEAAPRVAKARDHVSVRERALDAAIKAAANGKPGELNVIDDARRQLTEAEGAVPPDGRLLAGDITPEAMVVRMAAQGGRLAILEPEPGPLQLLAGRYSDESRLDEIKKAWSAEAVISDRISRDAIRVDRPALVLALMVQPGVIEELPAAFRQEGVLGRFLWCAPPHGLGTRLTGASVPRLDLTAATEYERVLLELLEVDLGQSDDGTQGPHLVTLSLSALEVLHAFEAEVESKLSDDGDYAAIRDWAGKLVGQSVRIAALLALARRSAVGSDLLGSPIGAECMASAVTLARALATHALHVLANASADGHMADLIYTLRRLKDLRANGNVTESVLRAATRGRASIGGDADTVAALVQELEDRGCVRRTEATRSGVPGRPQSPVIELHPKLCPEPEAELRI